MRIAIIGGGIAGLAAAYELEKARAAGAPVEYTLFEARERLGGSLASEIVNGAVLERGPDSFLTEKPAAAELCRELGLGAELLPSNDAARKTYILVRNRLVPLPDGLMFLVPTKLIPTALTRLFSFRTKIRMGLELLHPAAPHRPAGRSRRRARRAPLRRRSRRPPRRSAPVRHLWRRRRRNSAPAPFFRAWWRWKPSTARSPAACWPRTARCAPRPKPPHRTTAHAKQARAAAHLYRPARRNAAAGRRPCRAARSGIDPRGHAGQRHRENRRRLERSSRRRIAEHYDAVIVASPAWAAGALLGRRRSGARRGSQRHSLLLVDHHQSRLRREPTRPPARWLRLPGSRQAKAAPCWPAPLFIASFWAARRRAKPSFAPSSAA